MFHRCESSGRISSVSIRFAAVGFLLFSLFSTGCGSPIQGELTRTSTIPAVTSTLTTPLPAIPSEASLPPSQPAVVPIDGATSTQVNVRAEPSTAGTVLGVIPANTRIEIVGKDPSGNWWQINYPHPDAVDGKGWVTIRYIAVAGTPNVPIIGGAAPENSGNMAVIQQQLNVRSGPGTDFNSLGTLNAQDVVTLSGKDPNGAWLLIDFPTGPEGKGWVSAAFVQAQGAENLPIIAESGAIVGTGTPTSIPSTPTPTLMPAREDNDSANIPLASVTFDPAGTRAFIYNGDVSAPSGDPEDWIQFTSFRERVLLEVSCTGSDILIELVQNGQTFEEAACDAQQSISVEPNVPVQVYVSAHSNGSLSYSSYTVKVSIIL